MVDTPNKPSYPVFDQGPKYSDYVPNAYGFSPDELANRNAMYKRDRDVYDAQKQDILTNYLGRLENYNKAVASYNQQLSLNNEAQKAGYSSYDAYLSTRANQVTQANQQRKTILSGGGGNQSYATQDFLKQQSSYKIQSLNPVVTNSLGQPINTVTGTPLNTVSAFEKPGSSYGISDLSRATITQAQNLQKGRVTQAPQFSLEGSPINRAAYELNAAASSYRTQTAYRNQNIGLSGQTAYFLTAFASGAVNLAKLDQEAPGFIKDVFQNPGQLKQIPGALRQMGQQFGDLARLSPSEAVARIGGSLVYLSGPSRAISDVFDFIKTEGIRSINKILPGYAGDGKIGNTLEVIGKDGKIIKLDVVGKIPTESFKSQIDRAGQTAKVAVSSQGNKYFGEIRKPIPNEELLTLKTKALLKQFDAGDLPKNQYSRLNELIRKETGSKGLLERSFFADPSGNVRPSRLGIIPQEARSFNLMQIYENYFTSDLKFNKPKPQLLVFENVKVEDFPRYLKDAVRKIKAGKSLSEFETNELLRFQNTISRKFKPLGFQTRESEFTLAPGEMVKKVKKLGRTIIEGKVIPIVAAEVYRPVGEVLELLKKLENKEISLNQVRKLDELLYKETGISYELSAKYKGIKYIDPYKLASEVGLRLQYGYSPRQSIGYYPGSRPYIPSSSPSVRLSSLSSGSKALSIASKSGSSGSLSRDPSTGRYVSSPSSLSRPGYSPSSFKPYGFSGYSPGSPAGSGSSYTPPGIPNIRYPPPKREDDKLKYTTKRLDLDKPKTGYLVYVKQNGELVKMPGLPLAKQDAKDRMAFILNNRIVRTAKLKTVETKVLGGINEREVGSFEATAKNLREYRIIRGRKVATPNTFIEKTKYSISTRGEKADLSRARNLRTASRPVLSRQKVSFVTKSGKSVSFTSRR